MPMYRYVKRVPTMPRSRSPLSFVSYVFLLSGSVLLLWTVWPILSFSLIHADVFSAIVTPVSDALHADATTSPLSPIAFAAESDFTNANAWYPSAPQKKVVTPVNIYEISIPKLKIDHALVTIGGDDLGVSLVHYGGTGVPGEFGTTVIFGHSTLPQFYSPKNYKSIFSLLPTLEKGDEIFVFYDGISYRYTIFDMVVREPTDLSALEQKFDNSYLTLVTCVPPGTYWKRLNVMAQLESPL